jgi:hypothetical protein
MTSKTSFSLGFLGPNANSNQRLSAGIYAMSARSNVPFARLLGKGIDKIFTWGETVEVPKGQLCTVVNASYHAGDLFINSGCDLDNKPARITVPARIIQYTTTGDFPTDVTTTSYPADVRTARRAYLYIGVPFGLDIPLSGAVVGKMKDGSHNTVNTLGPFDEDGTGYHWNFDVPIMTDLGLIPLGNGSVVSDDTRPHVLLSSAQVYFYDQSVIDPTFPAYYVMEY